MYMAQSLRPVIVYVFENSHCNFANLVVPPTDRTTKRLVHWKVHLVH